MKSEQEVQEEEKQEEVKSEQEVQEEEEQKRAGFQMALVETPP